MFNSLVVAIFFLSVENCSIVQTSKTHKKKQKKIAVKNVHSQKPLINVTKTRQTNRSLKNFNSFYLENVLKLSLFTTKLLFFFFLTAVEAQINIYI